MKIIVDGMGGDNAPLEILKGCEMAVEMFNVEIIITGRQNVLLKLMEEHEINNSNITVVNAPDIITMEDSPVSVLKEKANSSMGVGLQLLRDGKGDAIVSAGKTGALLAGGTLIVKRIKGVKRAALAPLLPSKTGYAMLIDCGANVECRPDFLDQFGLMGSVYMKKVMNVESPRVGLANNGTEETKGTDLYIEAHKLLKENKNINFVGNVEGRGLLGGECDVFVSDGFTGNLVLKTVEGAGLLFMDLIRSLFTRNIFSKLTALMLKKDLKAFKKRLDYTETGGAVLMGLSKPVIKAHGNSTAVSFKNAIAQAINFSKAGVIDEIAHLLEENNNSEE
jgi:glycerol-3-phosphate acyltransferase PlsX